MKKTMRPISFRALVVTFAAAAGAAMLCTSGCGPKKVDNTPPPGAPGAVPGAEAVSPETLAKIKATQQADAARHAAQASKQSPQ